MALDAGYPGSSVLREMQSCMAHALVAPREALVLTAQDKRTNYSA